MISLSETRYLNKIASAKEQILSRNHASDFPAKQPSPSGEMQHQTNSKAKTRTASAGRHNPKQPAFSGVTIMPHTILRFPIGKFDPPESFSKDNIKAYIHTIGELPHVLRRALENVSDEQLDTPYRKHGWTVRQVVHHLADSHMNSFIRFKLALTEDNPTIKPYIESLWADMSDAKTLPIEPSLQILEGVHLRWTHLLRSLHSNDYTRIFTHPEHGRSFRLDTTLALYAWHSRHHFAHINSVIKSEFTL